ncbi:MULTISPECIES: cold shock small protein YmcF [Erwinia]|uniref:Cold-shock protein n=2 Tax=Erwinia TaxID=551 RepID=A0ABV4E8G6_9GAMM
MLGWSFNFVKLRLLIPPIKFRCPTCHGCQYRFSLHSITPKNPHGANCIFCKATMTVSYKAFAS